MSAPWRANREINDKIYRIKMRGLVMRLRVEQRELEEREFRSWLMWERYMMDVRLAELRAFREADHPRHKDGTFSPKGLTNGSASDTIPVRDCAKIKQLTDIDDKAPHKLVTGYVDPSLTEHWVGSERANSHRKDYEKEGMTKEQYAQRALDLAEMPVSKNVRGFACINQNIIVRYDVKTKDFVKAHIHYGVITMFKAEASYYEGQRKVEMNCRKKKGK